MKKLLLSIACLLVATAAWAQPLIETTVPASVNVCDGAATFHISVANPGSTALTGVELSVALPTGVTYNAGSLNETTSFDVQEADLSNTNIPVFSANNLAPGDSLHFTISASAWMPAIAHQQAGNVFRNQLTLTHNAGSTNHQTQAYNLLYPVLNIISVAPSSQNAVSGSQVTRTVTIVNAGNGRLGAMELSDAVNAAGVEWTAASSGTLNVGSGVLSLSGADFAAVGNGDNWFNSNESITITQTLDVSGCAASTVTSTINASWGCGGETVTTSNSFGNVTIQLKNPNVAIDATAELSSCFGSEQSAQEIVLTNNGQGFAANVAVDIYKSIGSGYEEAIFSAIDAGSITWQSGVGGTPTAISGTTYSTRNDGAYGCLGASPIGRVVVALPNPIGPGETIIIRWNTYHCCINECNNEDLMGWKFDVDYDNVCGTQHYNSTHTGEGPTELKMTAFTETPYDINDGETLPYYFTISSHDNNLPEGSGAHYALTFTMDAGIAWSGSASHLTWTVGTNSWLASQTNYNSATNVVTAQFDTPIPFDLEKSEITIWLTGDCSQPTATSGLKNVALDIAYVADETCSTACSVAMLCSMSTTTNLHCPITNCEGLQVVGASMLRQNFGSPDNDQNGLADASGALAMNSVRRNRAMVGDTLLSALTGFVHVSTGNPSWAYGYASSAIELGANLTVISATAVVFDASAATTISSGSVVVNGALSGSDQQFNFEFSPAELATGNAAFLGFEFGAGDSIQLKVEYAITGNIGGAVEEVDVQNAFYLSNVQNPTANSDKYQCDNYNSRFTLIGYFFSNASGTNNTVRSCTKVIQQNFYLSIGDCCDNYDGGNLFPYEYRNWAHLKTVRVTIPDYYTVVNIYARQRRTVRTNQTATQTVNDLTPVSVTGNTMVLDLEQEYKPFGGSLEYSDDGFLGTIYLELAPSCDVPVNTYQNIDWEFKFAPVAQLGGGETAWLTSNPDRIRYSPTNLVPSSTNPYVDGLGRTVTWNLNIANTTGNTDAGNAWLHIKAPSGDMELQYVIDEATGDTLQLQGDIFPLGSINRNSSNNYSVTATYSACVPDYIIAYTGYECAGYPNTFAEFICPYATLGLHAEPKPAGMQAVISGETLGGECTSEIEITVEVASVKFGHLDSLTIDITPVGGSLAFSPGSGALLYPLSGSFDAVADPQLTGSTYRFELASLNEAIAADGLPGVLNLSENRVQLRWRMLPDASFKPGDFALVAINGKVMCGEELPGINLAYDPSIRISQNTVAGLSADAGSSWGVAWADYDNDGLEDIYVAEYEAQAGSFLYHNNGNGTFTKVTSSPVVLGMGSALAGTWGDFNNDGYSDLYVANNIGAANALYQNNNGTFTRIAEGDAVSYAGYSHGASWVDYDNDGNLDLFVSDFMPTRFNQLFKGHGDGTFTQITNSPLVSSARYSIGATWCDYDNDGDMDVFVPATNGQANGLFRNDGAGEFTEITTGGLVSATSNSVGCCWGDYDNDGDMDLFVSNSSGQNNALYRNLGNGDFVAITSGPVVSDGGNSSGSAWVDIDNDGDLDLYVCNDQDDANVLYINDGAGNFSKPDNPLSGNLGNSYTQAWADYDNDGDLDVLVGNHSNEPNVFFENSLGACTSWACFKLEGVNSNRSAIGARVRVKANVYGQAVWQMREISAQSGGGAGSQSTMRALFGLGDATMIDSVIIQWPSGYTQYLTNYATNQCNDIIEDAGIQVCGTLFHDENGNCTQDANEPGIPGVLIEANPGGRFQTTNEHGAYTFYLPAGTHTLSQVNSGAVWTQTCPADPASHVLNLQQGQSYCGTDFSNAASCTTPDLYVVGGSTPLRKGFRNFYSIQTGNNGAYDAYDVALEVTFDAAIVPLSASLPWTSTTVLDTAVVYRWEFDTLPALTQLAIQIVDSVSIATSVGDPANISAQLAGSNSDCDAADNSFADYSFVVGPIDPNDLLAWPSGTGDQRWIERDQVLRYRIRFQNVGSFMAQNIVVTDVLPEAVDVSTLHDVITSHDASMSIEDNNIEWNFRNIMLPDSTTAEVESHGFVEFKIMARSGTAEGAIIRNQAAIGFDYEDPLVTNSVSHVVKTTPPPVRAVVAYPNPATGRTSITMVRNQARFSDQQPFVALAVTNAQGTPVFQQQFATGTLSSTLDCTELVAGLYIVELTDENGNRYFGKLMVQ